MLCSFRDDGIGTVGSGAVFSLVGIVVFRWALLLRHWADLLLAGLQLGLAA